MKRREKLNEPKDHAGTIVYLRDAHKGHDDECWVPCAKGDAGAVRFIADGEDD